MHILDQYIFLDLQTVSLSLDEYLFLKYDIYCQNYTKKNISFKNLAKCDLH